MSEKKENSDWLHAYSQLMDSIIVNSEISRLHPSDQVFLGNLQVILNSFVITKTIHLIV